MNNKVLIKLDYIEYNVTFEIFIPINELIWRIIVMIKKSSSDLIGAENERGNHILVNKKTNQIYNINSTVYETDIRNGTELIFL